MNVLAIAYLNRLSDLLFILARHANRERVERVRLPQADGYRPVLGREELPPLDTRGPSSCNLLGVHREELLRIGDPVLRNDVHSHLFLSHWSWLSPPLETGREVAEALWSKTAARKVHLAAISLCEKHCIIIHEKYF